MLQYFSWALFHVHCRFIVAHHSQNLHVHSFFVCFSYPDTVAEDGTIGGFCLICVSHLRVSHVTALVIWQFSFAKCCN